MASNELRQDLDPAEAARRFIAEERLEYQQVDLPGGIQTLGHDRSYLNGLIFDDGFAGGTLLDIGSSMGYFCLEALRRGGSAAVGIEPDGETVRQARAIASLHGLEPEYVRGDFDSWDAEDRRFEIVLCLNVLHHMFDPVHSIRRMMTLARRKIVLEVATLTLRDLRVALLNPLSLAALNGPSILLGDPERLFNAADRTFMFTERALRVLFNKHTAAFEPLRVERTPFKGRIAVEARKRDIGHLVVVAGPTSSGKSTLLGKLTSDEALRRRLGLDEGRWATTAAGSVGQLPSGRLDRLIFHYDMLCPFGRSLRTHDRDPALHLVDVAERVTFLTLMTPRERLLRQLHQSELSRTKKKIARRHRELLDRYQRAGFLEGWYESWFAFCDRVRDVPVQQTLLVNEGDYTAAPAADWRSIWRRLDGVNPGTG